MAHGLLVDRCMHTTPRDWTLRTTLATSACAASLSMGCGGPARHSPPVPSPLAPVAVPEIPPAPEKTSPRSDATPATVDAPPSFGTFASTGGRLGSWEASAGYCQVHVMVEGGRTASGVMFKRRLDELDPALTAMVTSQGTFGVVVEVGKPSRTLVLKAKQCARLEVKIPGGAGGMGRTSRLTVMRARARG